MIPGKDGSLQLERRFLNWVWYCTYDAASAEFSELVTDAQGHKHRYTVPASNVQPRVWTRQKALAGSILPKKSIFWNSNQDLGSFVYIMTDVKAPNLSFMNLKVLLVGDALAGFRPRVGSSTAQAALHALLLEKWMKGEISLEEMEEQVIGHLS